MMHRKSEWWGKFFCAAILAAIPLTFIAVLGYSPDGSLKGPKEYLYNLARKFHEASPLIYAVVIASIVLYNLHAYIFGAFTREFAKDFYIRLKNKSLWRYMFSGLAIIVYIHFASQYLDDKGNGLTEAVLALTSVALLLAANLPPKRPKQAPQKIDELGRRFLVERISNFVVKNEIKRMAVCGEWGAGKTHLLYLISERLRERGFKTAFVNPWQAKNAEAAIEALGSAIASAIGLRKTSASSLFGIIMKGIWYALGTEAKGFVQSFASYASKQIDLEEGPELLRLNNILESMDQEVFVFVDDMERASVEVVQSMFPVLDRLPQLKNCVFIFAIDTARIQKALGGDLLDAEGYLSKTFDLRISLPAPGNNFTFEMLQSRCNPSSWPKLAKTLPGLKHLLPETPRAALRFLDHAKSIETIFLNRYSHQEFQWTPFFIMLIIQVESPLLHSAISKHHRSGDREESVFISSFDSEEEISGKTIAFTDEIENELSKDGVTFTERLKALTNGFADSIQLETFQNLYDSLLRELPLPPFDLRWAVGGYQSLAKLTDSEMTRLEEAWLAGTGGKPFTTLLAQTFDAMDFEDINSCEDNFISRQKSRLPDCTSDELPRKLSSLKRHLSDLNQRGETQMASKGYEHFFIHSLFEQKVDKKCRENNLVDIRRKVMFESLRGVSPRQIEFFIRKLEAHEIESRSPKIVEELRPILRNFAFDSFLAVLSGAAPGTADIGELMRNPSAYFGPKVMLSNDEEQALNGILKSEKSASNLCELVRINYLHPIHCNTHDHKIEKSQLKALFETEPDFANRLWELALKSRSTASRDKLIKEFTRLSKNPFRTTPEDFPQQE